MLHSGCKGGDPRSVKLCDLLIVDDFFFVFAKRERKVTVLQSKTVFPLSYYTPFYFPLCSLLHSILYFLFPIFRLPSFRSIIKGSDFNTNLSTQHLFLFVSFFFHFLRFFFSFCFSFLLAGTLEQYRTAAPLDINLSTKHIFLFVT